MFKAIIIDDEDNVREAFEATLRNYFSNNVTVCASCCSAAEGRKAVKEHRPNLIFLDIDMPGESGFDFIESIENIDFEIVFVTAYNKYAVQAFQYHALDYLLKPINPDDLRKTLDWIEQKNERSSSTTVDQTEKLRRYLKDHHLGVSTDKGIVFLDIPSIIRCEASGNYAYVYVEADKKILVSRTLKELDDILSNHDFMRVHKSHLINLKKLSQYNRNTASIGLKDGAQIPLSRLNKEEFEKRIFVI